MNKFTHIFFDLDHTLWDFHANSLEALTELHAIFKLDDLGRIKSSSYFVERYVFHNERMWDMYRQNRISKSRLRKARFELALRDIGIADNRLSKLMGEAYLDICPKKTGLVTGALDVVKNLSEDHELVVLTNGFQESQYTKLEYSGLLPFFTDVITSERASAKKPHYRMYAFAEEQTGAEKSKSLMVGDNLEIDVKGAVEFGWRAIHFDTSKTLPKHASCIHELADLPSLVRGK